MPTSWAIAVRIPNWSLYIQPHTSAATNAGIAHGTMKIERSTPRPHIGRLSSSASASPMT